jgi:glycerol-3-phosphate acyltransferase PlsY
VPWGIVAFLAIAGVGALVIHNVPLGVGAGIAALPLVGWAVGEPFPVILGYLAMFLIMVIKRLALPRAAIAASVSNRQILLNRLLFDRDIRDREAWIHRAPPQASPAKQPLEKREK